MNLSRRHFVLGTAMPLLAQKSRPVGPRPNILVIMADDLADFTLGCYGNKEIRTPNIDLLAKAGVRFQTSVVCTPSSSASRATFFTGRTPRQHGIVESATPDSLGREVLLSDLLSRAGYQCGYVGKWDMGGDAKPGHGFNYTCTLTGAAPTYVDPEMSLNGESVKEQGYLAEITTRRAVDFFDRQTADKPFFLTAAYLNAHTPYQGQPQKYYDIYAKTSFDGIGWERPAKNAAAEKEMLGDTVANIRRYAASVTALDDQLPVLFRKLHEKKLWENTLVIFTADNGYLLGRHGLWSDGLASDPSNMYEEVVQVPFIWSWPGRSPIDTMRPEMMASYDVVPTLCDAVGIENPARNLCGRSFLPLVTGKTFPKKEPWKNLVFGHLRNTEMVRDTRYKLVLRDEGKSASELFDLQTDPGERVNQYENLSYVQTRQRLEQELANWRKTYA